jgi:hypothetical protein
MSDAFVGLLLVLTKSRISPDSKAAECSLPYSQMPTTGAFLETDEISQYPQAILLFLYQIPTSASLCVEYAHSTRSPRVT